ncbi:MAG: 30S ribosomal protein S2, partial [Hyphomicrobiales bacterium]
RQLLEAGVHFGHQSHRWNPKMGSYIYGTRNDIHIIDLAQTVPLLHQALVSVSDTVARGGRILFVGTKRQAADSIADAAKRCAQYYVNHRWLGGTLTNWKTISNSIKRLRQLQELMEGEQQGFTKKELLQISRERDRLERSLGGIKDMGGVPDMLFIIDTNKESIAIAEARKLGIPVIAIVDTNCDPDHIDLPIPGNDDAGRAITLYCDLVARAAVDGIERAQGSVGVDVGASENPMEESALEEAGEGDGATGKKAEKKPAKKADKNDEKKAADEGAEGFKKLKKPDGDADDLKQISGLGPVLEGKLNEFGIFHYSQIAAMTKDDVAEVDTALDLKGRIERDDWVKQAGKLAKG